MPDTQTEEQPYSAQDEDQRIASNLRDQRRRELMAQNQAADNDFDDEEGGDDDDTEAMIEADLEDQRQQELADRPSQSAYLVSGVTTFLLEYVLSPDGGLITYFLYFGLKLLWYFCNYMFFFRRGNQRIRRIKQLQSIILFAFEMLPPPLSFLATLIPGLTGTVFVSYLLDYNERFRKILGVAKFFARDPDLKAGIAMAQEAVRGVTEEDENIRRQELEHKYNEERQVQENGGRWRVPKLKEGSNMPGVASVGNSGGWDKFRGEQLATNTQNLRDRTGWVQPAEGWNQDNAKQTGRSVELRERPRFDIPDDVEYQGDNYEDYLNARTQVRHARARKEFETSNRQFESDKIRGSALSDNIKALSDRTGWVNPGVTDGEADNGKMKKAA